MTIIYDLITYDLITYDLNTCPHMIWTYIVLVSFSVQIYDDHIWLSYMIWSHMIWTHVHIWFEHTSFQHFSVSRYMTIIYDHYIWFDHIWFEQLSTYDLTTYDYHIWFAAYDLRHMIICGTGIWSYAVFGIWSHMWSTFQIIYGNPMRWYIYLPWPNTPCCPVIVPQCASWRPFSSLPISSFFLSLTKHCKTCPARPSVVLFALFLFSPLLMHVSSPIVTDLHPFAPILGHFRLQPQNMMFGEISPAIGIKLCPVQPFLCLLVLFLHLPMAPTSQRTHPHPSTSIFNCFHPFKP